MSDALLYQVATGVGAKHNNPPLLDRLGIEYASISDEIEALAARANAAPKKIVDDAGAQIVKDLNREANAFWKRVDGLRKDEKEPHLQATRDVDGFFKPFLDRSIKIKEFFQGVADQHERERRAEEQRKRDEDARKLREEAARQREIAARAEAAARPTQATKAETKAEDLAERAERMEVAPVVLDGAKTEWTFEITDYDSIDLAKLRPYLKREEVEKAIRQHVRIHKGNSAIAGVRIFEDVRAKLR